MSNDNNDDNDDNHNGDDNDDQTPSYVWWLMTAEHLKTKLQSLIDQLAGQHGSISFDPHITVSRSTPTIYPPIDELKAWIGEQQQKNRPSCHIYIPKSRFRVATGRTFTQSVLLAIHNMEDDDDNDHDAAADAELGLGDLRRMLVGGGTGDEDVPKNDDWFPHLSLLYSSDDEERRNIIAQSIDLVEWLGDDNEPLLCFDAIQCMQIFLPVLAPRDVQSWRQVTKLSLG
jgi:hypothetical protein